MVWQADPRVSFGCEKTVEPILKSEITAFCHQKCDSNPVFIGFSSSAGKNGSAKTQVMLAAANWWKTAQILKSDATTQQFWAATTLQNAHKTAKTALLRQFFPVNDRIYGALAILVQLDGVTITGHGGAQCASAFYRPSLASQFCAPNAARRPVARHPVIK